jgi:hypothetical protein
MPADRESPAFASLDLALDWRSRWRRVTITTTLQLINALGRRNPGVYAGADCRMTQNGPADPVDHDPLTCERDDIFHLGIPRLPMIAVRVSF